MRLDPRLLLMALLFAPWGAWAGTAAARDARSECRAASVAQALAGDEGDCFAVTGVAIDGLLMDDGQHIYAQPRLYNDPSSSGMQLGLSGWSDDEGLKGAAHLRVTGLLRRCAAESGGNLLPEGAGAFCERHRGLYLDVKQAATLGRVAIRRGVRADGAELGNLVPLAAGPVHDAMRLEFQGIWHGMRMDGVKSLRDMLPRSAAKPFAAEGALAPNAVIEIFGWRTPAWAEADSKAGWTAQGDGQAEVIACVMDAARAAQKLWSISTRDIGLAEGRPYICGRLTELASGGVRVEYLVDENPAVEG